MTESKLLDLNDCNDSFKRVYEEILELALLKQPVWLQYFLKKSRLLQSYVGYNHWSRAWEYPWAIYVAELTAHCRVLDVGGGGSSLPDYLSKLGHEVYVIDPSLRDGVNLYFDKNKSLFRNLRSFIFRTTMNLLKINSVEGIHSIRKTSGIKYLAQKASSIDYPDNYFDLIFLPQGVHHCNNWLRDAPRLLRTLKPGRQIMAIECGINRPEFHAAQRRSALLRFVGDRAFEWMMPPGFGVHPKGPIPLAPGCERVGRPHHDVSTAHLREAFGDYLTDVNSIELKGWILFWGYKK